MSQSWERHQASASGRTMTPVPLDFMFGLDLLLDGLARRLEASEQRAAGA